MCISPGCSGIICTNMFYMSVNKRLRGELVEAMVSYNCISVMYSLNEVESVLAWFSKESV